MKHIEIDSRRMVVSKHSRMADKGPFALRYLIRTRLPLISSAISVMATLLERDILLRHVELNRCRIGANWRMLNKVMQQEGSWLSGTRQCLAGPSHPIRKERRSHVSIKGATFGSRFLLDRCASNG